jgi:hypothetical protein
MSNILGHLIISHLQLQNAAVLRFTPLAVYIVAFKTAGFVTDAISLGDEFISGRREH